MRASAQAALCLLLLPLVADAAPPSEDAGFRASSRSLESALLQAVRAADFGPVRDGRRGGARVAHVPNVDVAVVELDAEGRPRAAANVLLSRDYPRGRVVPVDPRTLGTTVVRFTRWDIARWDGEKGWAEAPPDEDIVPGRGGAPLRFMAPYPASLFKLMVAFRVLRLVDAGTLSLDAPHRFLRDGVDTGERPVRGWLEPMVVESDNTSTEALVKLLHERGAMEGLNAELAALGLDTLQVHGTSQVTGRSWNPGQIHMTALDTARLLLLVAGGAGVLWRTPGGREVTAAELSERSRTFLLELLGEQGLKEGLTSTLVCGHPHARPGIPAAVPARWVRAEDGTVTVAGTAFGRDTRPCNAAARVAFLHKTGLTENYGSDAGLVRALPGEAPRHYVIAFLSNLGYRYFDAPLVGALRPGDTEEGFPAFSTGVSYTQRIAALGRAVDELMRRRAATRSNGRMQ